MKKISFAVALLAAVAGGSASANDGFAYECRNGTNLRVIDVVYLQRESSVPCEVNYIKDGKQETLWNATYTKGYCEAKAEEFRKRQDEWGWSCKRIEADQDKSPIKSQG